VEVRSVSQSLKTKLSKKNPLSKRLENSCFFGFQGSGLLVLSPATTYKALQHLPPFRSSWIPYRANAGSFLYFHPSHPTLTSSAAAHLTENPESWHPILIRERPTLHLESTAHLLALHDLQ
jgi:hypothetical protein